MIGYLEGKLRHKSPEYILIDVQGVGYTVHVPLSTFCELPDSGGVVSLHIHMHVREDAIVLFGFQTSAEREMFLHLVTVNGVGPKLALNILSGVNSDDLRELVLRQDHGRLRNIPGIGKKIAERILLELRDKLKLKTEKTGSPQPVDLDSTFPDALSALINLGYRQSEAEKALRQAQQLPGQSLPIQKLLKEALRLLA